jgi:predicted RNA-binding Zn-ribbon protein involved in translation (DUF1610 family)
MGCCGAMNPLLFRCPQTGRALDTGLDIHVHCASLQQVQPITLLMHCPQCGHRHVWKIADGWLREPRRERRTGEWRPL